MANLSQIKLPDNTVLYIKDNSAIETISRSGDTFTATKRDGTTFTFKQKDLTFTDGVNSFTVSDNDGNSYTVNVTPYIAVATQSANGLMSSSDKTKLDGVATGAEVNQNAFSNVKVGSTTLSADTKTDTLEFVAGDNITLTPTEASDKITISSSYTNTTYMLSQDDTDGHKFTLSGTDGYTKTITIPDANTTYIIEADTTNNKIKLIPSSGDAVSITVPFATNATNATNATKATQDESGNNIKDTYAASFSISDHTITLKNKNGTSLGTVTVPDNNTTYTFATGDSNGQIKVTPSGGSAQPISVKGLKSAAYKDTTDTYSSSGTDPVTGKAVAAALETLPTPMQFKGSLGTGGTITQLPTATASTVGHTYRVISNGTYAGQVAKDGDEFIGAELTSGTYSWVYIPSGDEPSGTVTSVAISNGGGLSVSGSPITSSGTITISHADTSSQASVDNSGRTYIQDISLDTYGHVTKITSATETVVNTDRYVNSATFAHDSTNDNVKMTLTRAGSDTATVSANIPKVSSSSAGVVPKGAAVSSQSQSTKFLREDGKWAAPSYTVNTNTTYTIGTNGNNVTLTPSSGGGSVQSITVPFATNATNATKATQDASGNVITTTYRRLDNDDFDTINVTELNAGDLVATGAARFLNTINADISGTSSNVTGTVAVAHGGTGATSAANARTNLGLGSAAVKNIVDTYTSTSTDAISGKGVAAALGTLDGTVTGSPSASNTLTAFSETDGKVSATFGAISITKSQVSDFPSTMPPSSHTHGNIQNGGTLQTNDVAIANGDKLVITDYSDSNKVARASLSFDGSTTNKALTPKGTWETFATTDTNTHRPIQMNGTEILGNNTTALNLKAGTNVSLSNSSGTVTITATDTKYTAGTGLTLSGTQFSVSSANASTEVILQITTTLYRSMLMAEQPLLHITEDL